MHRTIQSASFLVPLAILIGCTSSQNRAPATEPTTPRPIAILNGAALHRDSVQPALDEFGGDEILRETILDRELEKRCAALGVQITNDLLAQERALLGETLGFDSNTPRSLDVLEQLRADRGLGPVRFENLLRRSAMLRALVGPREPTKAQQDRALQSAFGEAYRVRLFVSPNPESAQSIRTHVLESSVEARPWVFAEQCAASSTHPSSDRGGLIASLNPASLGYPSALLAALPRTPIGTCSEVMSTESGYVVVYVEGVVAARDPNPEDRERVLKELRTDTQRLAMQRLAQEILAEQDIVVMDRALNWAWTHRR